MSHESNGIFDLDKKIQDAAIANRITSYPPASYPPTRHQVDQPPDDNLFKHRYKVPYGGADDAKILKNYVEIPAANWSNIETHTYIRYKCDGVLKTGARIVSKEVLPDGTITFILQKRGVGRPFMWSVNSKKISNIYQFVKKETDPNPAGLSSAGPNSASQTAVGQSPTGGAVPKSNVLSQLGDKLLFDNVETLSARIEAMETKFQRMEEDMKKMLTLSKRLYDAKSQK